MSGFRPAGFRKGGPHGGAPRGPIAGGLHGGTAFRDGWTAWRRGASRNPAAPRNAVSPWEAGAPRSAASRWEAAANPWLGAIARCSRTGSSNPSPSSGEWTNFRFLSGGIAGMNPDLPDAEAAALVTLLKRAIAEDLRRCCESAL